MNEYTYIIFDHKGKRLGKIEFGKRISVPSASEIEEAIKDGFPNGATYKLIVPINVCITNRDMKSNVLRFDYWFSFNYKRLRSILGWQLNEDVFHDTYLLLRKDLLFIDLPIIDKVQFANDEENTKDWFICKTDSEQGFSIKYDKGGIRFMNKFLSNKILDCAKVKDNASFLMEKEPITVDGTKYFKIMLSSPIIVKRSPSKKATIDKR